MVDQFNKRVENQGIPPDEMQAFCVELKGQAGELNDEKFDVIVVCSTIYIPPRSLPTSPAYDLQCVSAYHHFTSIQDVTNTLAYFLKPGGHLLVVDLLKGYNHHQHQHHKGHNHNRDAGHTHEGKHEDAPTQALFPESVHHFVPHVGGLDEEDMRKVFESAGLGSFSFELVIDAMKNGQEVKLFLAKGVKPAEAAL